MYSFYQDLQNNGFSIIPNVFDSAEIENILGIIEKEKKNNPNFRKNKDLFAIRTFLKEISALQNLVLNDNIRNLLNHFGEDYQLIKSIYFDKPPKANWLVAWHQDLTISIQEKVETQGFKNWLKKENYFSVEPPQKYLDNIITFRIHLDDCSKENGALRVLPKTHKTIQKQKNLPKQIFDSVHTCEAKKGDILVMKPLIWHSSRRTENEAKRRIIHLEFSNLDLPKNLLWGENIMKT